MQLPIVVSAILPLVIVPESNGWVGVVVGVVTWLVFLVDYVVHARHLEHYGRTRLGRFDLFVVVATAPWFLFPGAQAGQAEQGRELGRLRAGEQEPRGGGDDHEQVKAAQPGAPVAVKMAGVHHVVDQEHQPGNHADHDADPAI